MTSRRTLGPLHVTRDRGEPTRLLGAIFAADLSWVTDEAVCAQTDASLWFVDPGHEAKTAKDLCRGCPLVEPCLTYALTHHDFGGIWGGTNEKERTQLRKKRRAA